MSCMLSVNSPDVNNQKYAYCALINDIAYTLNTNTDPKKTAKPPSFTISQKKATALELKATNWRTG